MRMLLIIMFLSFSGFTFSQNWFPSGATWSYSEHFVSSSQVSYLQLEVLNYDTLIHGKTCVPIFRSVGTLHCEDRPMIEYVYEENDKVYFYQPFLDTFQVLYDFSLPQGQSWSFIVEYNNHQNIDTVEVLINSISTVNINGQNLQKLDVTYIYNFLEYEFQESHEIIEKIGFLNHFFYLGPHSSGFCDMNLSGGLRCYTDNSIGLYETGIAPSCDYISSVSVSEQENLSNSSLEIYPNPAENSFFININNNPLVDKMNYSINDINGKLVKSGLLHNNAPIDVSYLPNGFYLVVINESISSTKFQTPLIINK